MNEPAENAVLSSSTPVLLQPTITTRKYEALLVEIDTGQGSRRQYTDLQYQV